MVTPFIGQIFFVGYNYAPVGYALCNGALIQVSENDALFSLLGSTFGGDGRTTFGLPDLLGRSPRGSGTGTGLNPVRLGEKGGSLDVTITEANLPNHTHTILVGKEGIGAGPTTTAANSYTGNAQDNMYRTARGTATLNTACMTSFGSGSSSTLSTHNPTLAINAVIALTGIMPTQT